MLLDSKLILTVNYEVSTDLFTLHAARFQTNSTLASKYRNYLFTLHAARFQTLL